MMEHTDRTQRSIPLIITAAAAMIVFLIPALYSIINIGNVTGFAASALLMLYGIFFAKVNHWISQHRHQKYYGLLLKVILLVICVFAVLAVILGTLMIRGADQTPKENGTVVVLACDVLGEEPGPMLKERLDAAYDWLEAHPDTKCIVSGGWQEPGDAVEADAMYRYLLMKGIPADRLYAESRSKSTYENMLYSKEIIENNGLEPSMTIVTSDFHEYRSIAMAESLGIEAGSYPSHTAWWLIPTYFVRECAGILHWWLFGF
ncbi:MAG: YdcF family protein [Erysipelotrichaceae bacterium]|nr:YdcF family protein [Erysipelotrichaceae bacterium]